MTWCLQENGRRPRVDQIQDLMTRLNQGPIWRLHAFFKVLTLTGNSHFLHHLGLSEDEYTDSQMPKRYQVFSTSSLDKFLSFQNIYSGGTNLRGTSIQRDITLKYAAVSNIV